MSTHDPSTSPSASADRTTHTAAMRTVGQRKEQRRVIAGTVVGTAIEWYDFFLYAAAAGLVFNHLFFSALGPEAQTLVAFASVGLSFLFRPLGAFLAGYFGDRIGRKRVLMITLITMGAATALIGVLPTAAAAGSLAPILLLTLRILQGISAGGEWGGAALMAVEHAPVDRRGTFGSSPQVGVPLGLLLANGVLWLMTLIAPGDAFLEWGWRIPFLLSVVLIVVGYFIRHGVEESPVFAEIAARAEKSKAPMGSLLRHHWPVVLIGALVFAGNGAVGYMTTGGFIQNYATNPEGSIALERGPVLLAVTASAVVWLIFTLVAGRFSDMVGRRTSYLVGWVVLLGGVFTLFPLVNQGTVGIILLALALLSVGLGLTYGQQSAMYTELYPASIRFSGVSVTYALGSILGGAFSPLIAQWLLQNTGGTGAITGYLSIMVLISLAATLCLRDRSGIPLGPDQEQIQSRSPLRFLPDRQAPIPEKR